MAQMDSADQMRVPTKKSGKAQRQWKVVKNRRNFLIAKDENSKETEEKTFPNKNCAQQQRLTNKIWSENKSEQIQKEQATEKTIAK